MAKRVKRIPCSKPNVRLTIMFSDSAVQWLEQQAADRAITLAEVVRRVVDETRGSYIVEPRVKPPAGQPFYEGGARDDE